MRLELRENVQYQSLLSFDSLGTNMTLFGFDLYVRYHEGCSYGAHNQGGNAYGGINHSGTNFTPRRQEDIGNFSPCARSIEHTSYKCYEGNGIEAENCIVYRPLERVPRKETRNEGNYVNMDEKFYTREI
ncbi:hypothetical protein M9H77_36287 [Catharanthus roseus]|uniref:Uncharacterized protein n=1 Tax=Catharanthus roseus TaxID=4058 RepID=A0ACB9ZVM5_CATRO|nr:hypothetical protein M9H77_36287 [Catharanthus roseus]